MIAIFFNYCEDEDDNDKDDEDDDDDDDDDDEHIQAQAELQHAVYKTALQGLGLGTVLLKGVCFSNLDMQLHAVKQRCLRELHGKEPLGPEDRLGEPNPDLSQQLLRHPDFLQPSINPPGISSGRRLNDYQQGDLTLAPTVLIARAMVNTS